MKVTNIHLTAHQAEQLALLAKKSDRTMSSIIREGVNLVIADMGGEIEQGVELARDGLLERVLGIEQRLATVERHLGHGPGALPVSKR